MARAKDMQTDANVEVTTETNVNTVSNVVSDVNSNTTEAKETTQSAPIISANNGPSYNELLDIVRNLSNQVQQLQAQSHAVNFAANSNVSNQVLELLASRKSDKEVTIVHNCELIGGLTTHIELTGITIDFTKLGEQRVLSWQQFEECVSKYRSFFDRQIILLSNEHSDLSERYSVPCINRGSNHVVKREELMNIDKLSCIDLEKYINSLAKADKDLVFSYWLGRAYDKVKYPTYYDRNKLEVLNRLSPNRAFDNILTLMNGDNRPLQEIDKTKF